MNAIAAAPGPGLSLPVSYLLAAGILVVALGILYFVLDGPAKPPAAPSVAKFWYGIMGKDNRVSTSKVQFVLWTIALAFALLVIIFHNAVFRSSQLDPRYLLLLGFPAGAAVSAKAITTSKQTGGTVDKSPQQNPTNTPQAALKDIVSDDSGNLDLGDAQYFLFNIVALVAFFYAFVHQPTMLPVLPDTLVGLTSASAAAYVAKKAATSTPVTITAVTPQVVEVGNPITVYGTNLCGSPVNNQLVAPSVTIGGLEATVHGAPDDTKLVVNVTPNIPIGQSTIQVVTSGGQSGLLANAVTVIAAPPPAAHL